MLQQSVCLENGNLLWTINYITLIWIRPLLTFPWLGRCNCIRICPTVRKQTLHTGRSFRLEMTRQAVAALEVGTPPAPVCESCLPSRSHRARLGRALLPVLAQLRPIRSRHGTELTAR